MEKKKNDKKISLLQEQGTFNSHSIQVTHQLFLENEFFDPHDIVQVKYEMLRWVRLQGESVTAAAKLFGFSRPAFYQAQTSFEEKGLVGLISKKRGPKNRHKLSGKIMDFIRSKIVQQPSLKTQDIVLLIKEYYGVEIHPRSIERALSSAKIVNNDKKK